MRNNNELIAHYPILPLDNLSGWKQRVISKY